MKNRLITRAATLTVDGDSDGALEADLDSATVDITDMTNVSIYLNQLVDNGNVTLTVEKTIDGTNWAPVDVIDQSELPVGNNKSKELTLSDSNGMPLLAKQIKVTVSTHTGTGSYTMTAAGLQGY